MSPKFNGKKYPQDKLALKFAAAFGLLGGMFLEGFLDDFVFGIFTLEVSCFLAIVLMTFYLILLIKNKDTSIDDKMMCVVVTITVAVPIAITIAFGLAYAIKNI